MWCTAGNSSLFKNVLNFWQSKMWRYVTLKKNILLIFREAWIAYFIFRELWKDNFISRKMWSRLSRHFLPPSKLNVSISVGIFNHVHAWSDMAAACLIYPRKPLQNVGVRSLLLLSTRLSLKTMTLPMKTWINYLLNKLKQNRTARIIDELLRQDIGRSSLKNRLNSWHYEQKSTTASKSDFSPWALKLSNSYNAHLRENTQNATYSCV